MAVYKGGAMRKHLRFKDGIQADFSGGVNTRATPLTLRKNEVVSAYNVNLSKEGGLEKRQGYTKIISGTGSIAGLYAKRLNASDTTSTVFANAGGDLVYAVPSVGSTVGWTTLKSGAFTSRVWFAELFNTIYVGNATDNNLKIDTSLNVYNVGIEAPATSPTASLYHYSITGELVGTGDGTTTSFTHTCAHTPLNEGSITVHYTISSTDYTATDDGAGNISGTDCSGTVDYSTGEIDLTFATAPDSGTDITVDYEYGANLYGTYKYKVTFLRQGTPPVESNPSDEVEITVDGDAVQLTIPTSSDPQVNGRAIYRTTANGGTFFLLDTISDNTTTTYIDTKTDENLSTQLDEQRYPFPKAKYLTAVAGRLWGVNSDGDVVYSKFLRPDEWEELNVLKFPEDPGEITGLAPVGGNLGVFKENSIFLVNPSTDPPIIRKLTTMIGCSLPDTIVPIGEGVFFADKNDIYYLRGVQVLKISDKIQNFWRENLDLTTAVGFYYPQKAQYIISVKSTGETTYWLVFDLHKQAWTMHKIITAEYTTPFIYDSTTESSIFSNGTDVYLFGYGWTDNGTSFEVEVETRWETLGNPFNRKRIRRVYPIVYAEGSGTGQISIGKDFMLGRSYSFSFLPAAIWGSSTWGEFIWGFEGINNVRVDTDVQGGVFNFKFKITNDNYFNIIGVGYRYQEVGFEKVNPSI